MLLRRSMAPLLIERLCFALELAGEVEQRLAPGLGVACGDHSTAVRSQA
jgi:hypothetical protein